MKYILLISLMLVSCTTVPVERKFPEAPTQIKTSCDKLTLITKDSPQMTDVLEVVVENYGKYHECAAKTDAWNEWYTEQKKVFEEVK